MFVEVDVKTMLDVVGDYGKRFINKLYYYENATTLFLVFQPVDDLPIYCEVPISEVIEFEAIKKGVTDAERNSAQLYDDFKLEYLYDAKKAKRLKRDVEVVVNG